VNAEVAKQGAALGPILPAGYSVAGAGDFNRDGHLDYLLFNASTRQTAIWNLNNNVRIGAPSGPTIPSGYELIGAGEFNRDGKPDYLLSNPSTRQTLIWYLNNKVFPAPRPGRLVLPAGVWSHLSRM
jgi:FG-GAP repeat.